MSNENILIIGCGGREHMIAKKLLHDSQTSGSRILIYYYGPYHNVGLDSIVEGYCIGDISDNENIVNYARLIQAHLVIIGPEQPLENGLSDVIQNENIFCVGPTKKAARLETSKEYARDYMGRCNLKEYCPKYFTSSTRAITHELIANELDGEFVIKPDGLCGGKGVKVIGDHFETIDEGLEYIDRLKGNVVIEEKLVGEEFSLMSFSDGTTIRHTIPVKDYKRAFVNDKGPNTGSMGSVTGENGTLWFLTPKDLSEAQQINEKVILNFPNECDGEMRYQGVLYGSFMKTATGLKVIEFNCRFGDPECINLLSLLKTDLLEIFRAIVTSTLHLLPELEFDSRSSVFKYLVPNGYPTNPVKNKQITLQHDDSIIYANVKKDKGLLIELGSRTLGSIGLATSMNKASEMVEAVLSHVNGPLFHRADIGAHSVELDAYTRAGVNIDEGNRVVECIRENVESTFNSLVYSTFGDFAGMIRVPSTNAGGDPILVASTDGVGTKSILVLETYGPEVGFEMLGRDIVNHCINDTLVKGAKPLFFMDYFAGASIKAEHVQYFIKGVAEACRVVGCALLGGETAEMPDVYREGHSDLVGTIIGVTTENQVIDGKRDIRVGDIVIGLTSSGPHTNGYTLIRKIVKEHPPSSSVLKNLCATHRNYLPEIESLRQRGVTIHGLCHITGGGFAENPKRIMPEHLKLLLTYPRVGQDYPEPFAYLQKAGGLSDSEMKKTFNCGIGMLIFIDSKDISKIEDMREDIVGQVVRKN